MNFGVFKSIRRGGLAAAIAASMTIGAPLTLSFEGMKLKPYYDSVGIRTVCAGETEKIEAREYTASECLDRFEIQYGFYSYAVARFYNTRAAEIVTPEIHAAFVDMAYNVGLATVEKSSMIREINNGDAVKACMAILLYNKAGGKDCRDRSNNCFGVWDRRLKTNALCMKGATNDL